MRAKMSAELNGEDVTLKKCLKLHFKDFFLTFQTEKKLTILVIWRKIKAEQKNSVQ